MLSPKLASSIRELWNHFWAGGIANPLTAIEQITYLVFLKRLEDLDQLRAAEAQRANVPYISMYAGERGETYHWSYIRRLPSAERLDHVRGPVFDWMKNQPDAGDRMRDAVFVIPNANLLQRAVEIIDGLFVSSRNQDTIGDIYEMLLSEIAEAGKNGQFRTPRHIIRAMCDLVDPQFGDSVCDPACGTGGFLINAFQHILKSNTDRDVLHFEADGTALNASGYKLGPANDAELRRNHFYGFDFDRTMVRLAWMNMKLHGLDDPQIKYADTLGSRFYDSVVNGTTGGYSVILANPPFTGSIDKTDIGKGLQGLGTTKTELLFVELILKLLQIGGRAAVIVPEGVLFGSTGAHKALRRKLVTENQLDAVISLPGGVFQPYTSVKTSILLFNKGGKTDEVWFYEVAADGYTLNARRESTPQRNDLWDMVLKYRLRFNRPVPAYVDDATWEHWHALSSEDRPSYYARPLIADETFEIEEETAPGTQVQLFDQPEIIKLTVFTGLSVETQTKPKDWTVSLEKLATSDYRLDAGFHRPPELSTNQYDSPKKIIGDLIDIENNITDRLNNLLRMVEDAE